MPSASFQLKRNERAASLTLITSRQSIAKASNSAVKCERASAHGTGTATTGDSGTVASGGGTRLIAAQEAV